MSWPGLLVIAVALAMDAFAVAIVAGLTLEALTRRHMFRLAFHFGIFQAAMFAAGWFLGNAVHKLVAASDHWIAFVLLLLVGGNIIRGACRAPAPLRSAPDPTSGWQLVFLSFATSIDALAVGLSLALIGASVAVVALVIGLTAAALTLVGMALGRRVGVFWGRRVEMLGGFILIAIGIKIVWEHMRA